MSRPQPDPLDVPVRVNVSISYFQWKECKKKRWKWSEVFKAGFGVLANNGTLGERLYALEKEVEASRLKLASIRPARERVAFRPRDPIKLNED